MVELAATMIVFAFIGIGLATSIWLLGVMLDAWDYARDCSYRGPPAFGGGLNPSLQRLLSRLGSQLRHKLRWLPPTIAVLMVSLIPGYFVGYPLLRYFGVF